MAGLGLARLLPSLDAVSFPRSSGQVDQDGGRRVPNIVESQTGREPSGRDCRLLGKHQPAPLHLLAGEARRQ